MEAIKSLNSYWRQRAYRRLEDLPATRKVAVVRLGSGGGNRWRRSWKAVVVRPALRLKKLSILKSSRRVVAKLRDAYMNVMLMVAGNSGGGAAVWDRRIPKARQAGLRGGDFEKKLMVHLYNSVIAIR